ncbi:hypothetical protein D1220_29500 (plasmid) [Klebsiella pneumoniae]|nr:hypothetical protein D1220_29500 [Klebsiella pneumoniae]
MILYCNTFLQCTRSHRYVGTGIVAQTFVYARRWEGRKVGSYRSYPVTTPIYWGPSGMVAGEAIIISITGGFWFGLLMASFHWWRRKVNRLPPWDNV